jgi:outer membrane protein insertion porin family
VGLEGAVLFPEREILRVITLKPGAVYSQDGVQEDLRLVKQYYGDRGHIKAEVTAAPQLNEETKRVNLVYRIVERELTYVSRIDVEGNLRTRDVVVRREMRIYPGDAFDGAKIRKSIERLYNLGYFEEVSVDTEPSDTEHQEALIVRVKESKTGSFSFGGGFSSVDRLVGLVELEQRNFDLKGWPHFTGAGQDLRLRMEVGTVRRFFDLSFTEPWIFGHPLSFGVDAYNRTRLRERDLGLAFEEERRGGGVRLGKEFSDRVRVSLGYQLFRAEISDVVEEASADLKAEQGRSTTSVVGTGVSFDSRDNRFDPTRGFFAFTSADVAGGIFGADEDFYRMQAGASYYIPHGSRLVLESRVKTGLVNEYGSNEKVPIFERFFGGGSGTIRGYEERRVGPRDPVSNDPIGGETTLVATVEEVMTLFKDERGRSILKGSLFFDVGDVWEKVGDYGESFKAGVGVGARVNTPIGPVRLDLGFPLNEIDGEDREPRFHFNISRSF